MNPAYLEDASGFSGYAEAVYIPSGEQELAAILREASEKKVPVTIAGGGTGVAGGRVPFGGWVVSLEKFTEMRIEPGVATAGAGVVLRDLQRATLPSGQFYAPDPTEDAAFIGGTIATNASGSRSFLYGDTRRHVAGLTAILMDGTVLHLSRGDKIDFPVEAIPVPRTTKHSAGFLLYPGMDAMDLFIGSEGTLGVITQAQLRLLPSPKELLAGVVFFASDEEALNAVDVWRSVPRLRLLEYFDAGSLTLLRAHYPDVPAAANAALLMEQEIHQDSEIDFWEAALQDAHALAEQSWFATTDQDRERFRKFRHAVPEVVNDTVRRRGLLKMGTDFAVPIDRNREMLLLYREAMEAAFPGQYVICGHIGDAHVHVNILPRNAEEAEKAKALISHFAHKAVELGGTVGAEHGLGKRKAHFLEIQYTPRQIAAMAAVKRRFDPQWLLGRGTLFPVPQGV
ncbi:MAG TPA: FAD-binding oxidoreductase [Bryobacteraceae bacterium]|nr:FAD-binding oxidoreductase [Bryobacteraceae bacterium]